MKPMKGYQVLKGGRGSLSILIQKANDLESTVMKTISPIASKIKTPICQKLIFHAASAQWLLNLMQKDQHKRETTWIPDRELT